MQRASAFLVFFLLLSCEYFGLNKPTKEQLVKEEMATINWNDVDRYPLFENCSETADKETQKYCFQVTFISHVLDTLQDYQIVVHKTLNDTVNVKLLIDKEGSVSIISIEKSDEIAQQVPQLDSLISISLNTLPRVYPALKRNMPVAAKLNFPIVLKVQ